MTDWTRTGPPPTRVCLVASYALSVSDVIDLPEGRTWEDVDGWGVKYDTLHVTWRDGTTAELPFHADLELDAVDTKRPDVEAFVATSDGLPDYDRPL